MHAISRTNGQLRGEGKGTEVGHTVARVGLSPIEGAVLVDAKGMLLIGAEQIVAHEVVVLVSVAAKLKLISLFFVGRYAESFVFIVISDEIARLIANVESVNAPLIEAGLVILAINGMGV